MVARNLSIQPSLLHGDPAGNNFFLTRGLRWDFRSAMRVDLIKILFSNMFNLSIKHIVMY